MQNPNTSNYELMDVDSGPTFSKNQYSLQPLNNKPNYHDQYPNRQIIQNNFDDMANNIQLELQRKSEHCKYLEDEISNLKNKLFEKSHSSNYEDYQKKFNEQELIKELLTYKTGFETFQRIVDELKNDKQVLTDEKNSLKTKYVKLNQKYSNKNSTLQELKQRKEYFKSRCSELEQKIRSLEHKNNELEDEASNYQSALGIVTNFNLSDDDQNHNVKLNEDILSLHDTLENYVTNLKPNIDVDINGAKKLLLQYGSKAKISDEQPNKPLIKAVLQRHVLEEIFGQANCYFTRSNKEYYLESEIVYQSNILTNLMEKFYHNRLGNDEITRFTPIRIRQQIHTALGTRGFNDIRISESEIYMHNFIETISEHINKMMNEYRIIKDIEKKKYTKALAKDLVRDVVRIFYFRLKIQEPIAKYHWFENNEKINKSYMKGSWDEDDVEDMVVEICSFPLIYKPSHSVVKVYTPAKVFPLHITKPSLTKKLMNFGRKIKNVIYSSNDDSIQTPYEDEYDTEHCSTSSGESNYHSPIETINEENNY